VKAQVQVRRASGLRMIRPILAPALWLALLAAPAPSIAQSAPLSLDHRMLLRCSAAFALLANRQAGGEANALAFPPIGARGREYFVRASARVMDEAGLDRTAVAQALETEARDLVVNGTLAQIMPVCLSLLPPE
jgi:hypothetical protein